MSALRLLELQQEFNDYDDSVAFLTHMNLAPDRTKEQIAEEYGKVLKEFISK